ncbi:hypothetical protein DENSPDRAFT_743101, partial [Dentipellis sp. KUC8613]
LSKSGRPDIVHAWIGRRRPWIWKKLDNYFNMETFSKEFWVWWQNLQPEGRVVSPRGCAKDGFEPDWEKVSCRGKNGMISVVVSLAWWGEKASASGSEQDITSWKAAVADVAWVLRAVI